MGLCTICGFSEKAGSARLIDTFAYTAATQPYLIYHTSMSMRCTISAGLLSDGSTVTHKTARQTPKGATAHLYKSTFEAMQCRQLSSH